MSMVVAGLDLSLTSTGLVVATVGDEGRFDVLEERRIEPGSMRGMERLWYVTREVVRTLRHRQAYDVAIEGYAFAKRSSHAHAQGELGGVVRMALWRHGFQWWEVPPAVLKKYVAGKGNAAKDVMLREVHRRWGYLTDSTDLADADGLARAVAGAHTTHARKTDGEAWAKAERVERCAA